MDIFVGDLMSAYLWPMVRASGLADWCALYLMALIVNGIGVLAIW
jgi:hypothetical protein